MYCIVEWQDDNIFINRRQYIKLHTYITKFTIQYIVTIHNAWTLTINLEAWTQVNKIKDDTKRIKQNSSQQKLTLKTKQQNHWKIITNSVSICVHAL